MKEHLAQPVGDIQVINEGWSDLIHPAVEWRNNKQVAEEAGLKPVDTLAIIMGASYVVFK